jgi:hypothetical protein
MALKPRRGTWAYGPDAHTPVDAARALAWGGPDDPGDWHPVTRTFRGGHAETWRAADATLGWWGPDGARRLVVATADPATLPPKATWYLVTNLPRPTSKSAPTPRSAATRPWSTPRSASAGTPGSPIPRRSKTLHHRGQNPAAERGGAARRLTPAGAVLAAGATRDTRLAHPVDRAATLVAGMVESTPAAAAASPDELGRGRLRPVPIPPELTNYR